MKLPIAELPLELAVPVRALVKAANAFRGALIEISARPVEDVLDESEEVLRLADDVLNLWIDWVGLRIGTAEEAAAADAVGSNGASKQTTKGRVGKNGAAEGKGKQLRGGGKRGTVKRR